LLVLQVLADGGKSHDTKSEENWYSKAFPFHWSNTFFLGVPFRTPSRLNRFAVPL
jgi:hypothetical protein